MRKLRTLGAAGLLLTNLTGACLLWVVIAWAPLGAAARRTHAHVAPAHPTTPLPETPVPPRWPGPPSGRWSGAGPGRDRAFTTAA
jgi:hypothetical protein